MNSQNTSQQSFESIDYNDMQEKIVCLMSQQKNVYIAFFCLQTQSLIASTLQNIIIKDALNSKLSHFLIQNQFSKILMPNFQNNLIEQIRKVKLNSQVQILDQQFFDFEVSKNVLSLLSFEENKTASEKDKLRYIYSMFNGLIQVVGALINFLYNQSLIKLDQFFIENIQSKGLDDYFYISQQAYQDLQIFKEEIHPSMIKGQGRSKEGFSVFSLFDRYCSGNLGKKLLKEWFLSPTTNINIIQERLKAVETFLMFSDRDIKQLKQNIKNIYDFEHLIDKLTIEINNNECWRKLAKSVENSILMLITIKSLLKNTELQFFNNLQVFEEQILVQMDSLLKQICNFTQQKISINEGINQELDSYKKIFDNLEGLLDCYAQEVLKSLKNECLIKSLALTFLPQFGYIVLIPKEYLELNDSLENSQSDISQIISQQNNFQQKKLNQKIGISDDWELLFDIEENYYFKNKYTNKLDELYGDVHAKIVDTEQAILRELVDFFQECKPNLSELKKIISQTDVIISFSLMAGQNSLCRPIFSTQSILLVKDGRNILVEHSNNENKINKNRKNSIVPNDTFIYDFVDSYDKKFQADEENLINQKYSNRVQIITGANYSGKSVYLKQIGIIVFLAHLGSYVPAKFCKMGIFDSIYTQMNSSKNLDFTWSLQNMYHIIRNCTNRSIVLIDEFGKNTEYVNGISLLCSLVESFVQPYFENNFQLQNSDENDRKFCKVPVTIFVTHFHDIFNKNMIKQSYLLRFLTMEIDIDKEERNCTYLYRIKPGLSQQSHATHLMKQFFQDPKIMERSYKIKKQIQQNGNFSCLEEIQHEYLFNLNIMIQKISDLLKQK